MAPAHSGDVKLWGGRGKGGRGKVRKYGGRWGREGFCERCLFVFQLLCVLQGRGGVVLVVARPSNGTRERVGIRSGKRVCLPLAGLCRCFFAIFQKKIILAGVCTPHVSTNAVILE